MSKQRIRLKDRVLPTYTKGEEIFNMVTHIVGGGIGIATLVFCILIPAFRGSVAGVLTGIVFGVSMIALYSMSSIYPGGIREAWLQDGRHHRGQRYLHRLADRQEGQNSCYPHGSRLIIFPSTAREPDGSFARIPL